MNNLLKPMKNKIQWVLLIFIFLIIQVYCDLTLPQYTADIVDIGIQNANFQFIINTGIVMLIMVAISALATVGSIILFKQSLIFLCKGFEKNNL